MNCSISGQLAQEPVVSKNGDIFEKRLIVKHIESNGTCPITNEAMTLDDLIPLRLANTNAVKPRQIGATSLPALLQTFQNEWDSLMLETFHLKKQLETTRQELSQALYQSDAACRVIARTIKERDLARRELEQLKQVVGKGGATKMDVEQGLDNEARTKIVARSKELLSMRKAKTEAINAGTFVDSVASPDQVKGYRQILSQTPHKASSPGLLCVDLHPTDNDIIVTGGVDRSAVVLNRSTGKKEATLAGHGKGVSHVLFHPSKDLIFTGSADHTVKLWTQGVINYSYDAYTSDKEGYRTSRTISTHNGEIVGLSLHATHDYFVTASADQSWGFHSIETGKTLFQVNETSALTSVLTHPDGLIIAIGTADGIRMWDLKAGKSVATFQSKPLTAAAFSENGYFFSTASKDNLLKLWDLRGPKVVHQMRLESEITSLDYDPSGKYLAAATGSEVRVFTGKNLEHVKTFDEHTNTVTGVKFGSDAKVLASVSMDRTLKLWGPQ